MTWDSPIPSAEGESVYIAPADLSGAGLVMAEMARSILGEEGGQMAILSATPEAANQNIWIAALEELLATPEYENIELVDTVYGNDVPQDSQDRAEELLENPDLDLIMAPDHGRHRGGGPGRRRNPMSASGSRSRVWECRARCGTTR